jgi:ribonuclease-3
MNLAYTFKDESLLKTALTHPSLSKDKAYTSYQKLEFLGDNVLNLILAETLYAEFPDFNEGKLSQIQSNLARTHTLSKIAVSMGLDAAMMLDRGEEATGGRTNEKNLEDCLEALIAAVYLDSDYQTTKELFLPYWQPFISNRDYAFRRDAKSLLQEWSQKNKLGIPKYILQSETGLAHNKIFTVTVVLEGYEEAMASGSSIKKAEVEAAQNFMKLNGIESE